MLKQLRETLEFQQASKPFGTGSDIQQAITASTAAIQGLAGGDIAKALAGGAAPYLAEEIHRQTTAANGEVNKAANLLAHAVVNTALSLAKGENALAGASSAVTAEAVGMISQAYYGKKPSELDESQKQTISALASLAAGLAGGLVGDNTESAVSGIQTGKVTVENNYLSTTEKSRQTELNYKQNLTPQEKQERDALNRKDSDSDMAVYLACNKGGGDCQAERAKAKEAQDTYFNQTYLNPKEAQTGYKQIENLLESTAPNAKEVFNILDGYTQAFMTFGYTEEEARARAGTYVGSIYVLGGMSAVLSSNSLTKQFGKDVAGMQNLVVIQLPRWILERGRLGKSLRIVMGSMK